MFGGILILICTLMHIYVLWRISSVPFIRRHMRLKHLLLIMSVLWTALFSGLFWGHSQNGILASFLEAVAMTWMASLFLIFTCIFIADILTGFGFLTRRHAPSIRGWALIAGGILSVTALIQGHRAPGVDKYEVFLDGLPEELNGTKLAGLSDLHAGSQTYNKWLSSRVAQVNELKPDLVVLLGDIIEGHSGEDEDASAAILSKLTAPLGIYAVLGNHEHFGGRGDGSVTSLFDKAGITVIRDGWKELRKGLTIAGIDPPLGRMGQRDLIPGSITSALAGRPLGAVILLSHFPKGVEEAAKSGVGLMLSGHTHGGQIWPFSWIVKLTYPFLQGKYTVDGMTMIVSRGTGTWGPRMRLWKPGEIVLVTLHSTGKKNK
jgi:uncharacterized protein